MTFKGSTSNCTIETVSRSTPITGNAGIGVIDVEGRIDPKDPDHIHGSATKNIADATQTITWDLERR